MYDYNNGRSLGISACLCAIVVLFLLFWIWIWPQCCQYVVFLFHVKIMQNNFCFSYGLLFLFVFVYCRLDNTKPFKFYLFFFRLYIRFKIDLRAGVAFVTCLLSICRFLSISLLLLLLLLLLLYFLLTVNKRGNKNP